MSKMIIYGTMFKGSALATQVNFGNVIMILYWFSPVTDDATVALWRRKKL